MEFTEKTKTTKHIFSCPLLSPFAFSSKIHACYTGSNIIQGIKKFIPFQTKGLLFFFLNLYLFGLYSHSIPPEVSYHRQEVHRKHVSGYNYFSWLSTIFRSIKVHRNMWTFLQNHNQLRLNSSQTDSCPAQHIMESSRRPRVLIPDQAIKTPQFKEAFSDDPIFLTLKPKEGFGAPSTRAIYSS